MLTSMVFTVNGGHAEVRGATANCGEQGSFVVVKMAIDSQVKMRDIDNFHHNLSFSPSAPKRNSLDWKPLKQPLKNCDRDTEMQLFPVDGFWQGWE